MKIDLILQKGRRHVAVEFKASSAPEVGKGFWNALRDLEIEEGWIIAPVREEYPIGKGVRVAPIDCFLAAVGIS